MIAEPGFRLARAVESEASLVGLCLLDSTLYPDAAALVTPTDLFSQANQILWRTMAELVGTTWDMSTIADRLASAGQLDRVGGRLHLVTLAEAATSRHLIPTYCRAIREASARRKLQSLGADILSESEDEEVIEYATRQAGNLGKIAEESADDVRETFKAEVIRATKEILEKDGRHHGTMTGYPVLDGLLAGLQPSDLILVAARPSVGKTALGLNIAQNILQRGEPIAFASLEMSRRQILHRLFAALSGIDVPTIAKGGIQHGADIATAGNRIAVMPLHLTDKSAMSVPELRVFAKDAIATNGPGPLIIDYLGLIRDVDKSENRNLAVAEISRGLKALAKDLNIPVIALSQLSRKPEQRTDKKPALADLRDSGALEQDADVVLLLHRDNEKATLEIAKHRNGPTGEVMFTFDGPRVRFEEVKPPDPFRVTEVQS